MVKSNWFKHFPNESNILMTLPGRPIVGYSYNDKKPLWLTACTFIDKIHFECLITRKGVGWSIIISWILTDQGNQTSRELWFNPLILIVAKTAWWFWWNLLSRSIFGKIFEGEMFIWTFPTSLLQIFSKSILNF